MVKKVLFLLVVFMTCHSIASASEFNALQIEENAPETVTLLQETPNRFESGRHVLYVNAGPSFIISKYYIPRETKGNPKIGYSYQAGYEWTSKKGHGLGVMYSQYISSYECFPYSLNVNCYYLGLEYVRRYNLSRRWMIRWSLGAGAFKFLETVDDSYFENSDFGFGLDLRLGVEYKLSKRWGLSFEYCETMGFFSKDQDDPFLVYEKEQKGISNIYASLGLRFYF